MPTTVVHVIVSLVHGGAERTLTRIVPDGGIGADGARHLVVTLRSGGAFAPELRARGVPVVSLGMRPGPSALLGWWRLVRLLRRVRPALVLSWLYHADLVATLAVPFAGRPRLVWNLRGTAKSPAGSPWHTRLTVRLLARLSRRPWAVAANSHAGRRDHEALGYHPRRWIHLPNGIDTDRWRPDADDRSAVRTELGLDDDEVACVAVARVHPQKDHPTLLVAMGRLVERNPDRRLRLVLVGEGTATLPLPPAIAPRVLALGARDDLPRLLRGADLAVLSSAFGEGLPNVVAEAMATGLPAVVTDVGDAAELVGDTGWVVAPGDAAGLGEALRAAVDAGAGERRARGRAARERVAQQWSLDGSLAAYRELWTR